MQQALGCKGRMVYGEDGAWRKPCLEPSAVHGDVGRMVQGEGRPWGGQGKGRMVHGEGVARGVLFSARGRWCMERAARGRDGAQKGWCMERVVHGKGGAQRRHAVCGWQGVRGQLCLSQEEVSLTER